MRVWKYQIYIDGGVQLVNIPGADESKVVAIKLSKVHDVIDVWIEIDPDGEYGTLAFRVFGTGHEITLTPDRQTVHTGTVFDDMLGLVWHVYQLHVAPV